MAPVGRSIATETGSTLLGCGADFRSLFHIGPRRCQPPRSIQRRYERCHRKPIVQLFPSFSFFTRSLYLIHLFFSFRRLIPSRMRLHPPALDPFFSIFFPLQMFHVTGVFSAPSIFLVTLCISTLFPRPVALFFVKICSDSFFFQAVDIFVFQFVS